MTCFSISLVANFLLLCLSVLGFFLIRESEGNVSNYAAHAVKTARDNEKLISLIRKEGAEFERERMAHLAEIEKRDRKIKALEAEVSGLKRELGAYAELDRKN